MARVPLSKSQLAREKANLASYNRYLPALDLKRQQLMGERNRARQALASLREELRAQVETVGADIPMLAERRIDLKGLARLEAVKLGTQNVAGVRLPIVEAVEVRIASYSPLVRPHWVDAVAERLREAIRLRVELQVAERRIAALDAALTKVTQRVNLFEKVLTPEAKENIRRILVYLGDAERAAVVGAKLAKRKREEEAEALAQSLRQSMSGAGGTA
ncbi:MAG: V-type ATP synthase subunit D [Bdellovibrio bacteriovorus]